MSLQAYTYNDLNITEVENVVEMLHEKTNNYLEFIHDGECETAEDMKSLMLEYMSAIRSQTNILAGIKNRLDETNKLLNSNGANYNKIKNELLNTRF